MLCYMIFALRPLSERVRSRTHRNEDVTASLYKPITKAEKTR